MIPSVDVEPVGSRGPGAFAAMAEGVFEGSDRGREPGLKAGAAIALYPGHGADAGRLALLADLRQAIEHNGLARYCQPKVQVASNRLCGAEALVRWVPKARFEEVGLKL